MENIIKTLFLKLQIQLDQNLKNLEIFESEYSEVDGTDGELTLEYGESKAFFYWFSFPGCLPDSDPFGPFETELIAAQDAIDIHGSDDIGELIGNLESLPDQLLGLIQYQDYSISYNGELESKTVVELMNRIMESIDLDSLETLSGLLEKNELGGIMEYLAYSDFDFSFNRGESE